MKELDILRNKLINSGSLDESCVSAFSEIEKQLSLYHNLEETLFISDLHLVYMHTTPDGRKYIGITKNLPTSRWNEGAGYESQKKFYKAIQKVGWDNIEHKIIAAGLSEKEAKLLESELIREYKTYDPQYGYNTNLSITDVRRTEKDSKPRIKQEKSQEKSDVTICQLLIEKYKIKTVDRTIYFYDGTEYVKEGDHPFIERELLLSFNISSTKHRKEIVNSIMVLSSADMEDVFPGTAIEEPQEISMLLSAFQESGFTKVTEKDVIAFVTWLNETTEPYICLPMIMDQVFHIKKKYSDLIAKRMSKLIRNNGWKTMSVRRFSEYGKQRYYQRD